MNYTLDRFEEDLAVLEAEDGAMRTVPKASLPEGVKEGCFLTCEDGAWSLRQDEREDRIRSKMNFLWQ